MYIESQRNVDLVLYRKLYIYGNVETFDNLLTI